MGPWGVKGEAGPPSLKERAVSNSRLWLEVRVQYYPKRREVASLHTCGKYLEFLVASDWWGAGVKTKCLLRKTYV